MSEETVLAALRNLGLEQTVTRHGPVSSLTRAAKLRGVQPRDIVKTMVVRRGDDDYLFVLVPGDRQLDWAKLRAILGVHRLSLADRETAERVTGFAPGTITPFGARHPWPVIADATILGRRVSMGAGANGVSISLNADSMVSALGATVADISDPG